MQVKVIKPEIIVNFVEEALSDQVRRIQLSDIAMALENDECRSRFWL